MRVGAEQWDDLVEPVGVFEASDQLDGALGLRGMAAGEYDARDREAEDDVVELRGEEGAESVEDFDAGRRLGG